MRLLTIGLIVSLFIHYSIAANCNLVGYEGLTTININTPVDDDVEIFLTIDTENVVNAQINNPTSNPYMDVNYLDNKLIFTPSAVYRESFEKENYMALPRVSTEVRLTCGDSGTYDITYLQTLTDKNTFEPTFEKNKYEFTVPMPIGGNIELTSNFGDDIFATDYDVSNNRIDFTIEGDYSDQLEVSSYASDTNFKKHKCTIKTKTPFRLNQDTTYVLTATDVGNPTRSTTVEVVLKIDETGSMPSSPSFQSGHYTVTYHNDDVVHSIDKILIPVSEGVTTAHITLDGGYKEYFEHNVGSDGLEITLKSNLPENVIQEEAFVGVNIIASVENAEVSATTSLIVTMPKVEPIKFDQVFYKGDLKIVDGNQQMDPTFIGVSGGEIIIAEEHSAYLNYDKESNSINLIGEIPQNVITSSPGFIDIIIRAELGSVITQTVLIISLPPAINIKFDKPFYQANYQITDDVHSMDPVDVTATENAVITLDGDYKNNFIYDTNTKQLQLSTDLPVAEITDEYIVVIIRAEIDLNSVETSLIVSMPAKQTIAFEKVFYQADYSETDGVAEITPTPIKVTDGAAIELDGDYAGYFNYNEATQSIEASTPLPPEVVNTKYYIDVIIRATLDASHAETVLIVSMPVKNNLIFGKTFYETNYIAESDAIEPVQIEVVTDATVTLNGDYKDYFKYDETTQSIEQLTPLLPEQVEGKNYINVVIQATLGTSQAEAVLVVSMPGKENVAFEEILYKTDYSETDGNAQITPVPIKVTEGATIELDGAYREYFQYDDTAKSITLLKALEPEVVGSEYYIEVIIRATLGLSQAQAVLVVSMPGKENVAFEEILYKTDYSETEGNAQITPVPIKVTEGATVELDGAYREYFQYDDTAKSITLLKALEPDVVGSQYYIEVIIRATLGLSQAQAVLVVSMPGKENVAFEEMLYKTDYSETEGNAQITPVPIKVTEGATIELDGAYKEYFQYDDTTKSITLLKALEPQVVGSQYYIEVIIRATLGLSQAQAVLVVSMPGKENVAFEEIFYKATYTEADGNAEITPVTIEVTNGATVELDGAYKEYFQYDDTTKSITLLKALEPQVVGSQYYIEVIIRATLGLSQAQAVLVVSMPGKENVAFEEIFYNAAYTEADGNAEITPVTIQVTNGATIELLGDYKDYFQYEDTAKSITLLKPLEPTVVGSKHYVEVIIRATLGLSQAEAVLVVSMPGKENVAFEEIFYNAAYTEADGNAEITPVTIQVTNGATIELRGDYKDYFQYDDTAKSITLLKPLEPTVVGSKHYVEVIIRATLGLSQAEAVLVVSMPGKENVAFEEIFYNAAYTEADGNAEITPVTIKVTNGATIELRGDYKDYFQYEDTAKSITLLMPLEPTVVGSKHYIEVIIRATLGLSQAEAVLVVSMPGKENVAFEEIFYNTVYTEADGNAEITPVTIKVTNGATIELDEVFKEYFHYDDTTKSIVLLKPLEPEMIGSEHYIDVRIRATLGLSAAEAVLVVFMTDKESVAFEEIFYNAAYTEADGNAEITPVTIKVTNGATIELLGDYKDYFQYDDTAKSIAVLKPLEPTVVGSKHYIEVIIRATLGLSQAEAVLVVSMPGKENVAFEEIFYNAAYTESDGNAEITPVTIKVTNGATIELRGDYKDYFQYEDTTKSIALLKPLEPTVVGSNHYVEVIIRATLGLSQAEAVLVVSMPGKENVAFEEIFYNTVYTESDGNAEITPVTIKVTNGATIELDEVFKEYFHYDDTTKSIVLLKPLEPEMIGSEHYIDVRIRATLGLSAAEAVLVVFMTDKESVAFEEIFYEATYSETDGNADITPVTITVTDGATIELMGDYKDYFQYDDTAKSIKLLKPLEPEVVSSKHYIDVRIRATLGLSTAEAVLVVFIGDKESVAFEEIFYNAAYTEADGNAEITPVTIKVTNGATVELDGDYKEYFQYDDITKSIELLKPLEAGVVGSKHYIDVIIRATLGLSQAEAVLVVSMPGKENVAFEEIFYDAAYSEADGKAEITPVTIKVTNGATIELDGDFKEYFQYDDTANSIVLLNPLDPGVVGSKHYINVIIRATLGLSQAEAVLVVSMPGKENVAFKKVFYDAAYSETDGTAEITPVTIEVTNSATIELDGDYKEYFQYDDTAKSITLMKPLEVGVVGSKYYIDVIIRATLGLSQAEAVLVVSMPGKENVVFDEVFYNAAYSETDDKAEITPVTIKVTNGATIELDGDYKEYFQYDDTTKSITLLKPLEAGVVGSKHYIDVIIRATLGLSQAQAVLVVSMPGKENVVFDEVFYTAAYSETDEKAEITPVTIKVTNGATIELDGDYKEYFQYDDTTNSIVLLKPLEPGVVSSKYYIDVIIRATLGLSQAQAVLVVSMPGKENVAFEEIFYQADYSETDGNAEITPVSIKVTNGATIELDGAYKEYFQYDDTAKSIELLKPLEAEVINSELYIDVIIRATIGLSQAEAVLVVSMPSKEDLAFEQVYYNAVYSETNGNPEITPVTVKVTQGAQITLDGEYKEYFKYDDTSKSIEAIKQLPEDVISSNYFIDVTIRATLGTSQTEAVLIVSLTLECVIPPSAEITFTSDLVFKSEPSKDIDELLTATSTIDEEIEFSLKGDVPQIKLYPNGRLQTVDLRPGFYDLEVVATGTTSKATKSESLIISIESADTCNDGSFEAPYSFLSIHINEGVKEDSVVLPKGDGYSYEITSIQPNTDKFYINANGDLVAKTLDRESDEFGTGKAQYVVKIELIPENTDTYDLRRTAKSILISKEETIPGDDSCFALDSIDNKSNQITIGIIVEDENDHNPTFGKPDGIVVGYPESDLLTIVSPAYIIKVEATDKDIGENALLKYTSANTEVKIDSKMGYIYPTDKIYDNNGVTVKVTATDRDGEGNTSDELTVVIKTLKEEHLSILRYQNKRLEDLDEIMENLAQYADVRYLSTSVLPGTNPYTRDSNDVSLIIVAYAFDDNKNLLTAEELMEILDGMIDGLSMNPLPNPCEDSSTPGGETTTNECPDGGSSSTENPGGGSSTTENPDNSDDECSNGGLIAAIVVLAILLVLCLGGFIAFYFFKFRKTKSYDQMEEEGFPRDEKKSELEQPRFTKNQVPVVSTKSETDVTARRPTGYLTPHEDFGQEAPDSPPLETLNSDLRERRKSVVFNSNVEEINIEREAEDESDKKDTTTSDENTGTKL